MSNQTPLQKSIAEIEAAIREMTGTDYVAGICIKILTANLEYERDVIERAYDKGSDDMGNSEFGGRCEFLSGNDYYTKTYEHEPKN